MFGLGALEIVVVLAVALIVLGPQKFPEAARYLARFLSDIRHALNDVTTSLPRYDLDDIPDDPPQKAIKPCDQHE